MVTLLEMILEIGSSFMDIKVIYQLIINGQCFILHSNCFEIRTRFIDFELSI